MKKGLLVGCISMLLLITLGGGAAFYYFIYQPASGYVGGLMQVAEIGDLNDKISKKSAYQPPSNGELTQSQVDRFVRVQQDIRERLGARYETLAQKYDELDARIQRDGREPNFREMAGAWRDIFSLIVEAKRSQVDAINTADFSMAEYSWVREQFYRALGAEVFAFQLDAFTEAGWDSGSSFNSSEAYAPVPEKNRTLTAPFAEQLDDWIAFAWFGL